MSQNTSLRAFSENCIQQYRYQVVLFHYRYGYTYSKLSHAVYCDYLCTNSATIYWLPLAHLFFLTAQQRWMPIADRHGRDDHVLSKVLLNSRIKEEFRWLRGNLLLVARTLIIKHITTRSGLFWFRWVPRHFSSKELSCLLLGRCRSSNQEIWLLAQCFTA